MLQRLFWNSNMTLLTAIVQTEHQANTHQLSYNSINIKFQPVYNIKR